MEKSKTKFSGYAKIHTIKSYTNELVKGIYQLSKSRFFLMIILWVPICGLVAFVAQAFTTSYIFSLIAFGSVFVCLFVVTFDWSYKKYSRYQFAGDEHQVIETGDPRLFAAFTLLMAIIFYSLVTIFLVPGIIDYAMGKLEFHGDTLTEKAESRYRGPLLPKTAKDIYIVQSSWSDDCLILKFSDTVENLRSYKRTLNEEFSEKIELPNKSFCFSYTLEDSSHFFFGASRIVNGKSYLETTGKYSTYHGKFMAFDWNRKSFYYLKW